MPLHQSKAQFCSLLCCNWFIVQWIYADLIIKQMASSLIVPSTAFSVRACAGTRAPQAPWTCRTTDFLLLTMAEPQWWELVPIWMQNHELRNLWPALPFLSTKLRDRGSDRLSVSFHKSLLWSDAVARLMLGGRHLSVSVLQA